MPEYLAPGVYVEEVSFSAPTIEGVSTTTTGFAGPTLTGPIGGMPYGGLPATGSPVAGSPSGGVPQLLTSFGDFQYIYGGFDNLSMSTSPANAAKNVNYMAMAVKAFFDNGGSMLYVSRVFANGPTPTGAAAGTIDTGIAAASLGAAPGTVYSVTAATWAGGVATVTIGKHGIVVLMQVQVAGISPSGFDGAVEVTAVTATTISFAVTTNPGAYVSGGTVTIASGPLTVSARFPGAFLNTQQVTVTLTASKIVNVSNLPAGSLLGVPGTGGGAPTLYVNGAGSTFATPGSSPVALSSPPPAKLYLLTVQVNAPGASGQQMSYTGLGLDPNNPNYIGAVLGVNPPRPIDQLQNQVWFNIGSGLSTADTLFSALFPTWSDPSASPPPAAPVAVFILNGGDDGVEPVAANYTTALHYFEPLEDIAIVATPGASIYTDSTDIMIGSLIPHVERQRAYRVAILEAGPNLLDSDYETVRAQIDSSYSALYVPWVKTPNPLAVSGTSIPAQLLVPPSGFMAGVYARSDTNNSVAKAPANEVVLGAVDFERHITFAEQAVLNPLGINCLRFFPDRGYRVWGARTASSDTSLMYINVRRYLIYLEHSIDNGTQWAVFENNGPSLWARVKDSIDSFLTNEFAEGNLLGTSPSDAYFVRCDRTTMTQNDLDNGRMICLIGVALLKPAEFVIFRIGQMTASAPS